MKKNLATLLIAIMAMLSISMDASAEEPPCSHQWSAWTATQAATCVTPGVSSRTCALCGVSETQPIPATGVHSWSGWTVQKSATISKKGSQTRKCINCGKTETMTVAKLKPFAKFTNKTVSLKKSQKLKLKVNYAKGDSIKNWKSSNKKVVTVSKTGKITAKKKGTAKITVTMKSGKKATCTVKVATTKKTTKSFGSSSDGTVYWVTNGSVYHSTRDCASLKRSSSIKSGSLSDCPKSRPCKLCH